MTGATADRYEWLTVTEAADTFGKSVRTIRRWVSSGHLESRREGRQLLVRLSSKVSPEDDTVTSESDTMSPADELAQLRSEVTRLRSELEKLTALNEQLIGERDYLRQAHALALRLQTKAIEAPGERRWWQFWRD